eukprot:263164-Chlamydomonas_euryale.AAC.4
MHGLAGWRVCGHAWMPCALLPCVTHHGRGRGPSGTHQRLRGSEDVDRREGVAAAAAFPGCVGRAAWTGSRKAAA